jgi:hypothetical protein
MRSRFPHPQQFNYSAKEAKLCLGYFEPEYSYTMLHQVRGNNGFNYLQTGISKPPKIGEVFVLRLKETFFQTSLVVDIEEHKDGFLLHTLNSVYFYKVLPIDSNSTTTIYAGK